VTNRDPLRDELKIELEVLIAVSTFQPVTVPVIAELLARSGSDVRQATRSLEARGLIHGKGNQRLYATSNGRLAVGKAGAAKVRDISRLLYLWRRQQGGGR